MADDSTTDAIVTGALVVGGGLVAYFGGRWLVGRSTNPSPAPPPPTTVAATTGAPPLLTAGLPSPLPVISTPPAADDAVPVSSPTQVDSELPAAPVSSPVSSPAVLGAPPPPGALPRTFDPLFERYRGTIPIEYMRALAMRESAMKPATKGRAAWGLLQITESVRDGYNRAHGTTYARERLLEPEINVAMATWLLRTIIDSYQRNHGDVRNLRADWNNPRFAELLTYGWNAGWSMAKGGGVGRVVAWLKAKGAHDIDLDLVHAHARDAGASKHLLRPDKVRWCKSVAALYQRERALTAQPVSTPNA